MKVLEVEQHTVGQEPGFEVLVTDESPPELLVPEVVRVPLPDLLRQPGELLLVQMLDGGQVVDDSQLIVELLVH